MMRLRPEQGHQRLHSDVNFCVSLPLMTQLKSHPMYIIKDETDHQPRLDA